MVPSYMSKIDRSRGIPRKAGAQGVMLKIRNASISFLLGYALSIFGIALGVGVAVAIKTFPETNFSIPLLFAVFGRWTISTFSAEFAQPTGPSYWLAALFSASVASVCVKCPFSLRIGLSLVVSFGLGFALGMLFGALLGI